MKKVLVVDDASFMRLSLKTMLENNDYEVVGEAENGKRAVEMYKKYTPDIITMDLTMPEMDGVEAIKEIKGINSSATIVVISAMGQEYKVKEAIVAGAKTFIVKPFQEELLLKTLSKL